MSIPAMALRLPTGGAVVQTAVAVSANAKDNPNGDFCKVTGIVKPKNPTSPSLEFEVNLPAAWNRRVLQMGGGGYNGTLVTGLGGFTLQPANVDNPLKQGFVTVGTDGGHKSAAGFDGSFAMDDEALANFGKESVKKGHDVAIEIIKKAYGRAPERSYFIGGSQGGHEALDAAARYSEDYDGVVAHYPAYNVTLLHLGSLNAGRAVYEGGGAAWLSPAKTKLITDAVYATCDGLDGAKDGIISQVKACNTAFDVKTLRCANGTDGGDTCLSDAQLAAVAKITSDYKPGFAVAGMDTFPRWPLLEGALVPRAIELGPGAAAVESALRQGAPALYGGRPDGEVHHQPQPEARHDDLRSEAVSVTHCDRCLDHGCHRREPRNVQGEGRQDHPHARHGGRFHHTAQHGALLPATSEAVRSGRCRQLRPLLHDSRLRPRLRSVQREDRQPHGAAGVGRAGAGTSGPHGDRWEPQRESLASVV